MMTALTRRGNESVRKSGRGLADLTRAREGIEATRRRLREQAVFANRLGKKVARLRKRLEHERARLTKRARPDQDHPESIAA